MEKYMCSRFFIDFSDLHDQEHKLNAYLDCHFQNSPRMCVMYLEKLFEVVDSSTVCLMGHERKQTLNLIKAMACRFQQHENYENNNNNNISIEENITTEEDLHGNVLDRRLDFINESNSNHLHHHRRGNGWYYGQDGQGQRNQHSQQKWECHQQQQYYK